MKKAWKAVIIVISTIVLTIITIFGALVVSDTGNVSDQTPKSKWDAVAYYGCPNSKRVKRLNTKKIKKVI